MVKTHEFVIVAPLVTDADLHDSVLLELVSTTQ